MPLRLSCVFCLLLLVCLLGIPIAYAADTPIQQTSQGYQITYPKYTALVSPDGCLDSLRVGDSEFLDATVGFRHGSYFYQNGPLKTPSVHINGPTEISAKGDKAAVTYTFTPDGMTWTTENQTDQGLVFFLILPPQAGGAIDDKGQLVKTPVAQNWPEVTFIRDHNTLHVRGSDKLWGPFEGDTQVWEQDIAPHAQRTITFDFGTATEAQVTQIDRLRMPQVVPVSDVTLLSPRDYQVFQRQTRLNGQILISGRVRPACDRIEVRVQGKSLTGNLPGRWRQIVLLPTTQAFSTELPVTAGGWYTVEVRALKDRQAVGQTTVAHVGVGEVFVGAGQSNSTNSGQERIQETSGLVSSFSGTTWQLANDPQPGTHDHSGGGSFWPAFGDAMVARYHVPIGVAVTGHGGTSVNQWQPDGELFQWMMTRIYELGPNGFRAVLWHQGESDVGMPSADYAARLTNVIEASKQLAGWEFPWFVAQVSYINPHLVSFPTTRNAQKQLWDTGIAQEGPDTDTLTGDYRDFGGQGIHLSPKGLRAHGQMWAEKVGVYLDRVLAATDQPGGSR